MNLPNKITVMRILMIPIFMIFAFPMPGWLPEGFLNFLNNYGMYIAVVVYILASITDSIDGHIARKYNLVTSFGKFLDPIADKLLVTAALFALVPHNQCLYLWATMIIITREFVVTGIRLVAASEGIVIAAGKMGKLKMVAQTIAISTLLVAFSVEKISVFESVAPILIIVGNIMMGIAVILTVVSGYEYVAKNFELLKKDM